MNNIKLAGIRAADVPFEFPASSSLFRNSVEKTDFAAASIERPPLLQAVSGRPAPVQPAVRHHNSGSFSIMAL